MRLALTDRANHALRKRLLVTAVAIVVCILGGVSWSHEEGEPLGYLLLFLPAVSIAIVFGLYRAYRREKRLLATYVVEVDDASITQHLEGLPPFSVRRDEVTRIDDHRDGEISLSSERGMLLAIPAAIERRDELMAILSDWAPVRSVRGRSTTLMTLIIFAVTVVAFALTFSDSNRLVATTAGALLFCALIASLFVIRSSPLINALMKRGAWFVLLPAAAILARIISLWS